MLRLVSILALTASSASAFAPAPSLKHDSSSALQALNRREVAFGLASALIAVPLVGAPSMASAADGGPTAADLQRIKTGYEQIQYLLDNFEQETTGTSDFAV
jgi:hypothetical protein